MSSAPLAPGPQGGDDVVVPPDMSRPRLPRSSKATSAATEGGAFFKFVLLVNLVARPFAGLHERTHGIRLTEWRVLRALAFAPGPTSAGLVGEALGLDKMAASRAVRALQAQGRLRRRPDPTDGRRIAVEITRKGRDLVAQIEPSGRAREAALLEVLTETERATLDALMDRLIARARVLPDSPIP